ncbi:hypothetical protein QFC22_005311 [Naganishia vaughanmartiniae]|uniref:Uncharacterized protein n=1 Tax=Naganishia vaughanmartiniae TaxID=1424756 RepID=A0ACC2WT91_9TREE|nr:hypothetical protein QFC22_005311 [Naganishia vaughanmartiniae]
MLLKRSTTQQPVGRATWSPLAQPGAPYRFVRLLQQQATSAPQTDTSTSSLETSAAARVNDPFKSASPLQRQRSHFSHPLGRTVDVPAVRLPSKFGRNQEVPVTDEKRKLLEKIVSRFRNVRWAVAYGSGVFEQDGYDPNAPKPMIDFIFATSYPSHFHAVNLQHNPSHYPAFARWLGSDYISRVQEWGAGIWYATMVDVDGQLIKYGVISTDALCEDMMDWSTLYVAGRMHKPINLVSALRVALLMLPEEFTEVELWEQVAGISYAGDPRMSIPGAENPKKVQNIVRPQIDRFRGLYFKLLQEIGGVSPASEQANISGLSGDEAVWATLGLGKSNGSGLLKQNVDAEFRAQLLKKLPRNLKKGLERIFAERFETKIVRPGASPDEKGLAEKEFWRKAVAEPDLRKVLDQELQRIIKGPATSQSFKGLLTAGLRKSILYAAAKVGKWWKSKSKKA